MPFDQVLVRYQTNAEKHSGTIFDCAVDVVREEGIRRGLYRGFAPLFARFTIVFCCYLPVYEQLRAKVFEIGYFK